MMDTTFQFVLRIWERRHPKVKQKEAREWASFFCVQNLDTFLVSEAALDPAHVGI